MVGSLLVAQGAQLSGDLDGWDWGVGERLRKVGIYVYTGLNHFIVPEKLAQHHNSIILQ